MTAKKLMIIGAATTSDATGIEVARVRVNYVDATYREIPIRGGTETMGIRSTSGAKNRIAIPVGTNSAGNAVNYHAFAYDNPYPTKPIISILVTSPTNASGYYLRALTGLNDPYPAGVADWSEF